LKGDADMIDSSTINPYDLTSYKKEKIKVMNSKKNDLKKDLLDYHFDLEVTGSGIDRQVLLTAGYYGGSDNDSYFILDKDTITKMIDKLNSMYKAIELAEKANDKVKELHEQLDEYLKAGYIESITLDHRKNMLPPYFNSALYKAFIIRPNFKTDIDIPSEVNTGFNFLEVLKLKINEDKFDETMNYVRHYNDIPIHFIGYDYNEEVEKRKKEAMKDLDKASKKKGPRYTDKERNKYMKMMKDMNIPFNVLNPDKK